MQKQNKGFTLVELLVVVSIIGILSTIVLGSLGSARQKSRDAKRASDLMQIKTALEMYYNDNRTYPNPGWGWRSECVAWGGFAPSDVIPGLVPTYLANFPTDPSMDKANSTSCYLYLSNGADYAILDHNIIDPGFNYQSKKDFIDPTRDSGTNACVVDGAGIWAWKVSSVGGACW